AVVEAIIALGALAFVIVRYGRLATSALHAPRSVASWLDRAMRARGLVGGEKIALLSAVELSADRGRFGESAELGDAAIAEATELAFALDSNALVRKEAWTSLRFRLFSLVAFVLAVAAFAIFS